MHFVSKAGVQTSTLSQSVKQGRAPDGKSTQEPYHTSIGPKFSNEKPSFLKLKVILEKKTSFGVETVFFPKLFSITNVKWLRWHKVPYSEMT